jgi:hypothetical protein
MNNYRIIQKFQNMKSVNENFFIGMIIYYFEFYFLLFLIYKKILF